MRERERLMARKAINSLMHIPLLLVLVEVQPSRPRRDRSDQSVSQSPLTDKTLQTTN